MNDFRQELEDYGVPANAVEGMIREQINSQIGQAARLQSAVQQASQDPWWKANADGITRFYEGDPQLQRSMATMAQTDPETALEFLALKYRREHGDGQPAPRPASRPQPSRQSGTTYLIPGIPGFQAAAPPSSWDQPVDVEQARAEYRANPSRENMKRFAKARLRTVISDEFLNQ